MSMHNIGRQRVLLLYKYFWNIIFFLALLFLINFLFFPGRALAEGINGYLQVNYSSFTVKTEDETGEEIKTKTDSFNQLYSLNFRRTIFPNLLLNTGGLFEKNITGSSGDGEDTDSSNTKIRPFVDLTLRNNIFTIGGQYNLREERIKSSASQPVTNVSENYSAIFGWKPERLPSLDLRYERSNIYDKERLSFDTVTDFITMNLRYMPEYGYLKGLEILYRPSYSKIQNRLDDIVTTNLTHNGRLTFSDLFFNRRVSLATSYNISHAKIEVIRSGATGETSDQLFPFSGLSAIDDTPSEGVLNLNSALIDGNLIDSSGIDIGLPVALGDIRPRNIGLDFVIESEVNSILIWVNRELPEKIANSFRWDIYTSSDNQNWEFAATIKPAPFGPFQNAFEINFSNLKKRYIKVVTSPLKLADTIGVPGDFSNILVTEIQAFLKVPSGKTESHAEDTRTNHIYNLDVRTRILEVPSLFYEFSYYLTKVASSFTNSTITNGLSLSHSFNRFVSAQARIAREDSSQQDEKTVSNLYNASITARPLKTLYHTLNYSGQTQETNGERTNTNAVYLNNTAELYKGINININGGLSFLSKSTGEKTKSNIINFGAGFVPNNRITLDLFYTNSNSKTSGGDNQDSSDFNRRGTLGVTYKPFATAYVFASVERVEKPDKKSNLQNYGLNWSPFPDGSLQFNFNYNESLDSDEGKTRLISPSVRWNISKRTYLEIASQFINSESESQRADSAGSSATFRTVF